MSEELRPAVFERFAKIGLSNNLRQQVMRVDHGREFFPELDATKDETEETLAAVRKGEPLSANISFDRKVSMVLRKGQKVEIK